MTAKNLEDYPIDSYGAILNENDGNNQAVRDTLLDRGIIPEKLPAAEDTDKIMTRLKADDKRRSIESSE
jgi:DNA-damage-inducible protein D